VTDTDADTLRETIRDFVEGDAEYLDVPPGQVQFCFRFMRELLNKGKNAAIRLSELQKENAILRSMVPADGGGVSKEAMYLGFVNSHECSKSVQTLRSKLKESCDRAKELNDELPILRERLDELEGDLENFEAELQQFPERIEAAQGKGEKSRLRGESEEIAAKREICANELEELRRNWSKKLGNLNARKEEIVALQRELAGQRAQIRQDFEEFWNNSMVRNAASRGHDSPRPAKPKSKVYATLGPGGRPPPK
jgi:DNA repair exonuclease SbcCD ATPase subunit